MTIHRINTDDRYPFFAISSTDIRKKMGDDCIFHMSSVPKRYACEWKEPVLLEFDPPEHAEIEALPDLVEDNGRLFLSERAHNALRPVIKQDGEFLPIVFEGGTGYIFNPLKVAEEFGAVDESLTSKNEFGEIQSLVVLEEKVPANTGLFKTEADNYIGLFCTDQFKEKVEESELVGVYFHPDLSDIFGGGRGADH